MLNKHKGGVEWMGGGRAEHSGGGDDASTNCIWKCCQGDKKEKITGERGGGVCYSELLCGWMS